MSFKFEERNRAFQQPPSTELYKQGRQGSAVALRQKKRMEHLSKKRARLSESVTITKNFAFPPEKLSQSLAAACPNLLATYLSDSQRFLQLLQHIKSEKAVDFLILQLTCLKQLLSDNPKIASSPLFDYNLTRHLVYFLNSSENSLISEVLWCLINIFSGCSAEIIENFVKAGAVDAIIRLIRTTEDREIKVNCVWSLGNLLGEGGIVREICIRSEVSRDLMHFLHDSDFSLRKTSFWALCNYTRGPPSLDIYSATEILNSCGFGLQSEDPEILMESAWISFYLTDQHSQLIDKVASYLPHIIQHIRHPSLSIQYPIIKVLGNISTSSDSNCEALLNLGAIREISTLLTHQNDSIKKETLYIFSNLFSSSLTLALDIIQRPCVKFIVELMHSPKFGVKKEAIWAICNAACHKSFEVCNKIFELEAIPLIFKALNLNDSELVYTIEEAVMNLITVFGNCFDRVKFEEFLKSVEIMEGFSRLQSLIHHENKKISSTALRILDYFSNSCQPMDFS